MTGRQVREEFMMEICEVGRDGCSRSGKLVCGSRGVYIPVFDKGRRRTGIAHDRDAIEVMKVVRTVERCRWGKIG